MAGWLTRPGLVGVVLVVLVLVLAAAPVKRAKAHSGEWISQQICWTSVCVTYWVWQQHEHRDDALQQCEDQYGACIQFCQIAYPGEDREVRKNRRVCYSDCAEEYARCRQEAKRRRK